MAMASQANYGTGRRKSAVARVYIKPGKGSIVVNNKPVDEFFSRETGRMLVRQPLELLEMSSNFDISVNVTGGGESGQAGAVQLAVSRALAKLDSDLQTVLRKNGFLTRDPRSVERKKYGQPKARKRFQYSKR